MDDDTTTSEPVEQPAAPDEGQPAEQPIEAPEPGSSEPSEPSESDEDDSQPEESPPETTPEVDDKLRQFADSQGIDLDSPGAIKAAQIALKARGNKSREYREQSKLEQTVEDASDDFARAEAERTGQDPDLVMRVQRIEAAKAVDNYYRRNPDAEQYDDKMGEIARQRPHLLADLDALYATAVFESGKLNSVKSEGKREALKALAHSQKAAVPTGNATTSASGPRQKKFADLSISEMEAKLGFLRR